MKIGGILPKLTRRESNPARLVYLALIFVTLLLILLQSLWLAFENRFSRETGSARMQDFLRSIVFRVQDHFFHAVKTALAPPPSVFEEGSFHRIGETWARREVRGAEDLFVVDVSGPDTYRVLFYRPSTRTLADRTHTGEGRGILARIDEWRRESLDRHGTLLPAPFLVDLAGGGRALINPVFQSTRTLVGFVGMTFDLKYLTGRLLPASCEREFNRFFPHRRMDDLALTLVNRDDDVLFASHGNRPGRTTGNARTADIPFLFPGWYLRTSWMIQEEMSRTRVLVTFTLTVSVLLLLLLLAELALLSRRKRSPLAARP